VGAKKDKAKKNSEAIAVNGSGCLFLIEKYFPFLG